jgi:phage tail P2-like protein
VTESLLPGNLSDLERGLDLAIARMHEIDIPLNKLWDPLTCPVDVLPFLAWALSVDDWVSEWPENIKRQVVANSLDLHKIKGTRPAIEHGLNSLSLDTEITEWFETEPNGVPGTFNVDILVNDQGITEKLSGSIHTAIKNNKRATAHYLLRLILERQSKMFSASFMQNAITTTVQPSLLNEISRTGLFYRGAVMKTLHIKTIVQPYLFTDITQQGLFYRGAVMKTSIKQTVNPKL